MSNLLDRASILLTPTAVSDSELHSVKPVRTFGSELVSQPNFQSQGSWTTFNNNQGTISGGTATIIGDGSNAFAQWRHSFTVSTSKKYELIVTISETNHNVEIAASAGASDFPNNNESQVGTHTFRFTPTATTFGLKIGINNNVNGNATLTFASLKEVTDGDFDFTRATTATRVNSSGLIESVASGLPRIDFTGGTGQILLEPASTNLEVSSGDLSTSFNTTTGATAAVETGLTPFGVSGNIKRLSGATNSPPEWTDNANLLKKQFTVTATDPASFFTFSVYVKSAGSTTVNIQLRDNTAGPAVTTGAISLTSDWQRVTISKEFTTSTIRVGVVIAGTDGDILLSGAQFENSSFATSLIPTSGSTVTRNKDQAINSGDSSLINSTEGVLYAEIAALRTTGNFESISISDGTSSNVIKFFINNSENAPKVQIISGSANQGVIDGSVTDVTAFNKLAIRYKNNDCDFFVNGVLVGTDTSVTIPSGLDSLSFSSGPATSNSFEGKVKSVAVFKEFLDNDELECLTGSGFDSFTALAEAGSYTII